MIYWIYIEYIKSYNVDDHDLVCRAYPEKVLPNLVIEIFHQLNLDENIVTFLFDLGNTSID